MAGPVVRNGAIALMYHRATRADVDPWRLAVDPDHLSEHLDILARHTHALTAAELVAAVERGRVPPRSVVVTFDDGYADLATEVAPRLERADVAATMFLVSRAIDRDREFWWDGVERALLGEGLTTTEPLRLTVRGTVREWHVDDPAARPSVHHDVWTLLRGLAPEERDATVDELLAWAALPTSSRSTHRTLSSSELERLVSNDLVEIGAHTANHPWLAGLDRETQRREIEDGRAEIEALVGHSVDTFAYPHGGADDIGPHAVELVRRAGFASAFSGIPERLSPRQDIHALPRLFVEDMDGEGFARLLWQYAGIRVS